MAINYAARYDSKVDEAFSLLSLSDPTINKDYDFTGVDTVKVYSIPTAAMNNYTLTGSARYGTPAELQNVVQTLLLTKDRSFTFTIDRRSLDDTMGVMAGGEALARQLREVVIPEIDIYRFGVQAAGAGTTALSVVITKANAHEQFLAGMMELTNKKVPIMGRIAVVTAKFFSLIKQDPSFIKQSDMSQLITLNGQLGSVDGVPLIVVPDSYLPTGVNFMITHPVATTAPVKLADYKIHDNPPGINGMLVEGRFRYDAFVLNNKKDAIYVSKSTAA